MIPYTDTHTPIPILLDNEIHLLNYPAWILNERTLRIVDANYKAMDFCMKEEHSIIGLSILDLWHDENLLNILNDFIVEHFERCFFSSLKHKMKNGVMETFRVRATRLLNSNSNWVVHLIQDNQGH